MIVMDELTQLTIETKKYLTKYDYDNVLALCDNILDIYSRSRFGLEFKAISLYRKKEYDKSLKLYEKLSRIYPNDEEILYSLMLINDDIGDYESAVEYSKRLLKLHDNEGYCIKYKHLLYKSKELSRLIDYLNAKLTSLENDKKTTDNIKRLM
ncbi:MAG: hypothetical protein Q4Q22_02790, partial [Methanosphaera sp.]|nr:hypothetical protein [Methanosphaera sp.]